MTKLLRRVLILVAVMSIYSAGRADSAEADQSAQLRSMPDGTICVYVDQCPMEPPGQNGSVDAYCRNCFGPGSFAYPGCLTGGDCEPEANQISCAF